ncbi:MAG: hypothetical protein JWN88_1739 [Frankiales bacterium]|nr:hypothetical protein [Frankiales bacterium]
MSVPLMLHSLTEHRAVIFGCLEAVGATSVVEVGSEYGGFTTELATWAAARDARVASVEPFPAEAVRELDRTSEHFRLVEGRSPQALRELPPADAYVLDGDHTYWTVLAELQTIDEMAEQGRHPLVILHDVGWPSGRRDQYYAPDALEAEHVLPHAWDRGVVPGNSGVVEGGFRGEGQFAVALEEGGPHNGVLTAVEDYLAERPDLVYAHVPSVFGLGVVYSGSAESATRLEQVLAPYDRNPQLQRLEENRIAALLRIIELQDELRALSGRVQEQSAARSRLIVQYADRLAAAEAENAALRLDLQRASAVVRASS